VGACAAEGVEIEQQLDQMLVDRLAARLNKEDVLVAHHFIEHHVNFAVRHTSRRRTPQINVQDVGNLARQRGVSRTGEDA
jgi:hypothetical protein